MFKNHGYQISVFIPDTATVIEYRAFKHDTRMMNEQAEFKPENRDDAWNHKNGTVNLGYNTEEN